MRVMKLSAAGAVVVDEWESGQPIGAADSRQRLARRLVDAGMAHPVLDPVRAPAVTVGVVIPVRDDPDVGVTVRALGRDQRVSEIVVVDDGSDDADALARSVASAAADMPIPVRLERRARSGGPAAARNVGWPVVTGDVVAFVDANVVPDGDWLAPLLPHLADPTVVAVAPRVRARPSGSAMSPTALDRYEACRSPLDLGPDPARVATGGRVAYVPTTAVVVRRDALERTGGFDEALRYGEDVDLVWRLIGAGLDVRYEPAATVSHRNRGTWSSFMRQRVAYGSAAAALDRRHPRRVAPVAVNAWSLGAWTAAGLGGRRGAVLGLATGAASTAALAPRLRGRVDLPAVEAIRLGGAGHLWAGVALARASLRPWLPLLLVGSLLSRRVRRLMLAVAVGIPVGEWVVERPDLDPIRWTAARLADDAAYSAGVWVGCVHHRRVGPLLPSLGGIEGLSP